MKAETVPGVYGHGLLHDKPDLGSGCGCSAGRWRSTPTWLRARSPRRRSSARRPHWPCRPGEGQGLAGSFGETGSFKILLDQTCDTISTGVRVYRRTDVFGKTFPKRPGRLHLACCRTGSRPRRRRSCQTPR